MIKDYKGNFWSEGHKRFKGVAFATSYDFVEDAEDEVENILNNKKLDSTHGNTPVFIIGAYSRD